MNDEINKPHVFQKSLSKKIDSVILAPGEEQIISQLKQYENSLNFWKNKYEDINKYPLESFNNSVDLGTLQDEYTKYKQKILEINSKSRYSR